MIRHRYTLAVAFLFCSLIAAAQTNVLEHLNVDATDAPRNILHSTITIPVTPGAVTIVYPKWIPGNHRPTGPIQNFTGLHFKAGWQGTGMAARSRRHVFFPPSGSCGSKRVAGIV